MGASFKEEVEVTKRHGYTLLVGATIGLLFLILLAAAMETVEHLFEMKRSQEAIERAD